MNDETLGPTRVDEVGDDTAIDVTRTLQSAPTFRLADLPDDLVDRIASRMSERVVSAGKYLMRQGEQGDSLVLLLEGSAEVSVNAEGRRRVLQRIGPGTIQERISSLIQRGFANAAQHDCTACECVL